MTKQNKLKREAKENKPTKLKINDIDQCEYSDLMRKKRRDRERERERETVKKKENKRTEDDSHSSMSNMKEKTETPSIVY